MAKWKLCFVLLLPLTVCFNGEVTAEALVKTIGSKPDVTPVCSNSTTISLIVCKIRTEKSREECLLLYRHGHGFEHRCDSRFRLMTDNRTVFLHLTNLKSVDGGIYTCECAAFGGTYMLHLNVTVKDEDSSSSTQMMPIQRALIGATVFIIMAGVTLGFIYRTKSVRDYLRSATSGSCVRETPKSLDQDHPDDPYVSLQHTESEIYQTASTVTAPMDNQEISGRESDPSYMLYENI